MFPHRLLAIIVLWVLASFPPTLAAQEKSLAQQIADVMVQVNGGIHPGFRFAHAKGLVLTGTFTPAAGAASISRAAHLRGAPVPVTVRLSDGAGVPQISDDNRNASPRGMAIRFALPGGAYSDIVAISHNGFLVGTGDDFLALFKAIAATTPTSPHPSPIEQFLGGHPRALKFITDNKRRPRASPPSAISGTTHSSSSTVQGPGEPAGIRSCPSPESPTSPRWPRRSWGPTTCSTTSAGASRAGRSSIVCSCSSPTRAPPPATARWYG